MRGIITYIEGHDLSTKQAKKCLKSYKKHGWDVSMVPGVIPSTLNRSLFPYPVIKNGRLNKFSGLKKEIKISCLFNNLLFCKEVIENNEPMARMEHDSICISSWDEKYTKQIEDFCFLSYETTLPLGGHHSRLRRYNTKSPKGINDFPNDYPIIYKIDNLWKGAIRSPGTAAYILTPSGAKKILRAAEEHGLEQSDFIINSKVLRMQYIYPSVATYNINLKTSNNFEITK
jgi:GR25 family glycosyltransferase involved in LPS biosynthesis